MPVNQPNPDVRPIGAYGAIGNDDRCALVADTGSIDWLCLPHVESPSVFAAILDRDAGGRLSVTPTDAYESTQAYVDETNVLQTTFDTDTGRATVTDCMPVRSGDSPDERFQQAVYRKLEGVRGTVDVDVRFAPRFDYGRSPVDLEVDDRGDVVAVGADPAPAVESFTGEWPYDTDRDVLHLHSADRFSIDADTASASRSISLDAGDERWLCLQYGAPAARSPDEYETILSETIQYWRSWLADCREHHSIVFEHELPWQDILVRSALALKLLIHGETGAIPAAPTTSLPEELGGKLNWDYRYNWIRDAKFTVQALYTVGQEREAHQYFEWFRDIAHEDPDDLLPLYGLHGERDIDEEILDHFSGYRDSTPVRIGNAASDQRQLDIYGTIVQGMYETIRYGEGLSDDDWQSIHDLAQYVCDHWQERDESIWEFRDLHEHFVHSKLLCWVALDRAIDIAETTDHDAPRARWDRERTAIRNAIETRGYNDELGSFVQFFDADRALDATALLIPVYDFLPADDERVLSTIETILEELTTDDGLVVRFANSPARPRESGGFVICSCWLVDALVLSGRIDLAETIFESLLGHASSLGLFSEMVHVESGELLGNYPQAFSHIGVLNSAVYLASARDDVDAFSPADLATGGSSPLFRRHEG